MASNPLLGTWKLVSMQYRRADGGTGYPHGPNAVGYIIYTEQRRMMVAILGDNRPSLAGGDPRSLTVEQKAVAFSNYISYSGTYDYQGDRVLHHVDVSLSPAMLGTTQIRYIHLEGDRLTLTPPPTSVGGVEQTLQIVWERVPTSGSTS